MIVIDIPMPKNCLQCPVRMECDDYRKWAMDLTKTTVPKPMEYANCKIKGVVRRK